MKLFLSVLVLAFSMQAMAADPTAPTISTKDTASDVEPTYVKPTTEQTATVSKAAVRAKKLKKKEKKDK